MQVAELGIRGAWLVTPQAFEDSRGAFWEWYRFDVLEKAVGHALDLRQANASVSRRGVVRGIHFADVPPSQAKYVTVTRGAILDYVVDIRVGSPTFGQWESVRLDAVDRHALYLSEGLGHAFVSLADDTVVTYLVSDVYRPDREHGITPLDPEVALTFPDDIGSPILSDKDLEAPSLREARETGLLPDFAATSAYVASLGGAR